MQLHYRNDKIVRFMQIVNNILHQSNILKVYILTSNITSNKNK